MITTYEIRVGNDVRATFSADFTQASSPILLDGNSTPYQVADARHRPGRAAQILIRWCDSQGGEIVGDEEYEVRRPKEGGEYNLADVDFHIPPRNQGQIVEVAYGWLESEDGWRLIMRRYDRGERKPAPRYWVSPIIDDDDVEDFADLWEAEPTIDDWTEIDAA